MNRRDEVFAMFIEANPVSALDVEVMPVPSFDELVAELGPMPRSGASPRSTSRPRTGWVVAAAAFVLVVAVAAVAFALFAGETTTPPVVTSVTTTVEPTTTSIATTTSSSTTTADPLAAAMADAERVAREFLAALVAGDIDAVMALSTSSASDVADRRVHEFLSALTAANPMVVGDCIASFSSGSVRVECEVTLGDPVVAELGTAAIVYPLRYEEGLLAWQSFEGVDIAEVNRAYSTYLRAYLPDAYRTACSPAAYDPLQIVQSNNLALTGECGELAASVAEDVVQWIRDGRPDPGS